MMSSLPTPGLAHAGHSGGGGVALEFLIMAGAVLALAFGLQSSKAIKPFVFTVLIAVAAVLGTLGFVLPEDDSSQQASGVTVAFAAPEAGEEVPADKPVEVRVTLTGGSIAQSPKDNGGHLHLSVDGELQQMPHSTTTEIKLEPGEHTLTMEFVDSQHISFSPPIETSIEVEAVE